MDSKRLLKFVRELLEHHRIDEETSGFRLELERTNGDRLVIEQEDEHRLVRAAYVSFRLAEQPLPDIEVRFLLNGEGSWIPIVINRMSRQLRFRVWAKIDATLETVSMVDPIRQDTLALYCDTWSYALREQGWMDSSTKVILMQTNRPRPQQTVWPKPTTEMPSSETLEAWLWDGTAKATDGCSVPMDGQCLHGCPSWLLELGLV